MARRRGLGRTPKIPEALIIRRDRVLLRGDLIGADACGGLRGSRASLLIAKPGRRRFRWQLNRLLRREHLDIRANGYGYDHRAPGEGSASASELVARGSGRYRWHLVPYCGSHRAN